MRFFWKQKRSLNQKGHNKRENINLLAIFALLAGAAVMLFFSQKPADIAFAENEPVTFTDVTASAGVSLTAPQIGASWGDYDNDGDLDVYVGNHFNTSNLYRNNGNGTFTDVATSLAGFKSGPSDWHGAAWGDSNNDGYLDLYVVQGAWVANGSDFYENNQNGTFTEKAVTLSITNDPGRGRNTRWVDYDNDGDLDLHAVNGAKVDGPDVLYRNNGNGTSFADVAVQASIAITEGSNGVSWADYDKDGDVDFGLSMSGNTFRLYRNNGGSNPTFTDVTSSAGLSNRYPTALAWGDYDNDGDLDLYMGIPHNTGYQDDLVIGSNSITAIAALPAADDKGLTITNTSDSITFDLWQSDRQHLTSEIWIGSTKQHPASVPFTLDNNTAGYHVGQPSYTPGSSSSSDKSVFVWRDGASGPWKIYWNNPFARLNGTITTPGQFTQVISDNFTVPPPADSKPNRLFRNNGNGTFSEVNLGVNDPSGTHDAQWIDFDNDGDLDLSVTNFGSTYSGVGNQDNRLYRNNGNGTSFTDVASGGLKNSGLGNDRCTAWDDYNNDGFLDAFVINSEYVGILAGPHRLYKNNKNSNHWLRLKLTGVQSNKLGVGAKISLTTGGTTQYREVGIMSGQACHSSYIAHFGLGSENQADITITWPSGIVQQLDDVSVDQLLNVTEGGNITPPVPGSGDVYLPIVIKN